jgi:DNA-directed RNA polymerase beta' subunit
MGALIENFEEILNHFLEKKNQKFYKEYKFIVDNIDKVFIQYLPVINSRLRPAILVDGVFSFDAINNLYNQLIQNSNLLKSLSTPERIPLNIYALQYKNQKLVNEIYDTITSNLSSKEGYIRSTLFGNRLNFTSRCVITPLDGSYDIDDIVIPYNAALELLKPQVLRRLANLKKCTLTAATEIFNKAVLEFDSLVYKIMIDIIENGNVRMLLNRNPSINLGSILMVKIAGIKRDMSDLTVSLHNLILKPIGGDYDGDVLNFILLYGQEFIDLFAKFKPSHIMIDMDNGTFNKAFLPAKDTILGLESLFN